MESIDILENPVTSVQVVAIIQIILKGGIRWTCNKIADHLLCDRHVDIGPDGIGYRDVVTKLRATQHAILMSLVIAGAHDDPAPLVCVVGTLNDRIVLYTVSVLIHWNTLLVEGQRHHMCVGSLRDHRLKWRRNTVLSAVLGRNLRRRVLTGHRLAGIDDITRGPRDIQSSLDDTLLQDSVKALTWLELDQEVNAVVACGLPLVEAQPRATLTLLLGCNRR